MLEKLIAIKGIGLLHEAVKPALKLGKHTAVYGDNARGKTTFTAILRALNSGDGTCILERRTINGQNEPYVEFLIGGKILKFENGNWNSGFSQLVIFDEDFVTDNVYSGSTIDPDQRKNLHQFALGSKGVGLARTVEELDGKIRDINQRLSSLSTQILGFAHPPITIEEFISLNTVGGVDELIVERQKIVDALADSEKIRQMDLPFPITLPLIDIGGIQTVLSSSISAMSIEVERRVRKHVDERVKGNEQWIHTGVSYANESCPFCEQDIQASEIVDAYRSYFDETYVNHKTAISNAIRSVEALLSDPTILQMREVAHRNVLATERWSKYVTIVQPPSLDTDILLGTLRRIREGLLAELKKKLSEPLESLILDESIKSAVADVQPNGQIAEIVRKYNAAIQSLVEKISSRKAEVAVGDINIARAQYREAQNVKARHSDSVTPLCTSYLHLANDKKVNEKKKKDAKNELDEYTNKLLSKYQDGINNYVKQSGARFQISNVKTSYAGGKPRMEYAIEVFGKSLDLSNKTPGPTRFRTGMSQGDKNTLAFAFFLARLDNDQNLSTSIVVFDDPLSSLDATRRTFTRMQIERIAQGCEQIIVLSHDLDTAAYFAKAFDNCEQIRLKAAGDYSLFEQCDLLGLAAPEYFKNWNKLWDFDQFGKGELLDVARSIRPMLEENLRVRFPDSIKGKGMFGEVLKQIRNSKPPDPEHMLLTCLNILEALNEYTWRYHHGNPNVETTVTEGELKNYVRIALDFSRGTVNVKAAVAN